MYTKIARVIKVVVLVLMLFIGASTVSAAGTWVPPISQPTENNVEPPVNTSSTYQQKTGSLGVGASVPVNGTFFDGVIRALNFIYSPTVYGQQNVVTSGAFAAMRVSPTVAPFFPVDYNADHVTGQPISDTYGKHFLQGGLGSGLGAVRSDYFCLRDTKGGCVSDWSQLAGMALPAGVDMTTLRNNAGTWEESKLLLNNGKGVAVGFPYPNSTSDKLLFNGLTNNFKFLVGGKSLFIGDTLQLGSNSLTATEGRVEANVSVTSPYIGNKVRGNILAGQNAWDTVGPTGNNSNYAKVYATGQDPLILGQNEGAVRSDWFCLPNANGGCISKWDDISGGVPKTHNPGDTLRYDATNNLQANNYIYNDPSNNGVQINKGNVVSANPALEVVNGDLKVSSANGVGNAYVYNSQILVPVSSVKNATSRGNEGQIVGDDVLSVNDVRVGAAAIKTPANYDLNLPPPNTNFGTVRTDYVCLPDAKGGCIDDWSKVSTPLLTGTPNNTTRFDTTGKEVESNVLTNDGTDLVANGYLTANKSVSIGSGLKFLSPGFLYANSAVLSPVVTGTNVFGGGNAWDKTLNLQTDYNRDHVTGTQPIVLANGAGSVRSDWFCLPNGNGGCIKSWDDIFAGKTFFPTGKAEQTLRYDNSNTAVANYFLANDGKTVKVGGSGPIWPAFHVPNNDPVFLVEGKTEVDNGDLIVNGGGSLVVNKGTGTIGALAVPYADPRLKLYNGPLEVNLSLMPKSGQVNDYQGREAIHIKTSDKNNAATITTNATGLLFWSTEPGKGRADIAVNNVHASGNVTVQGLLSGVKGGKPVCFDASGLLVPCVEVGPSDVVYAPPCADEFLVSSPCPDTTWVVPNDIVAGSQIRIELQGGGGGGGGGQGQVKNSGNGGSGGGGGNSGDYASVTLTVGTDIQKGQSIVLHVGGGGVGGAGGYYASALVLLPGVNGSSGGASYIKLNNNILTASIAKGGCGAYSGSAGGTARGSSFGPDCGGNTYIRSGSDGGSGIDTGNQMGGGGGGGGGLVKNASAQDGYAGSGSTPVGMGGQGSPYIAGQVYWSGTPSLYTLACPPNKINGRGPQGGNGSDGQWNQPSVQNGVCGGGGGGGGGGGSAYDNASAGGNGGAGRVRVFYQKMP